MEDNKLYTALAQIVELGTCAHSKTPKYMLFDQAWDIAEKAISSKPSYENMLFDLLETLKIRYPEIAGAFARGTGGVELPYILEVLREAK